VEQLRKNKKTVIKVKETSTWEEAFPKSLNTLASKNRKVKRKRKPRVFLGRDRKKY